MGPERFRPWFPASRLAAFVIAVAATGLSVFEAVRPEPCPEPRGPDGPDVCSRRQKRIRKNWKQIRRAFSPARSSSAPTVPPLPEPDRRIASLGIPASALAAFPESPLLPALPRSLIEDPGPFTWGEESEEEPEARWVTPELAAAFLASGRKHPLLRLGNAVLSVPERIVDSAVEAVTHALPQVDEGILARLADLRSAPGARGPFEEFLETLVDRERRYFAKFGDSDAAPWDEDEPVDLHALEEDQRKILWDVFRKTLFAKYSKKTERRLREDAFVLTDWRGLDYLLLPPALLGYVYYRGIEKRFSIGDTCVKIGVEPLSDWVEESDDLVGALTFEWRVKGWPLGLIVAAGLEDGKPRLDFVGIGTGTSAAMRAVSLQRRER